MMNENEKHHVSHVDQKDDTDKKAKGRLQEMTDVQMTDVESEVELCTNNHVSSNTLMIAATNNEFKNHQASGSNNLLTICQSQALNTEKNRNSIYNSSSQPTQFMEQPHFIKVEQPDVLYTDVTASQQYRSSNLVSNRDIFSLLGEQKELEVEQKLLLEEATNRGEANDAMIDFDDPPQHRRESTAVQLNT